MARVLAGALAPALALALLLSVAAPPAVDASAAGGGPPATGFPDVVTSYVDFSKPFVLDDNQFPGDAWTYRTLMRPIPESNGRMAVINAATGSWFVLENLNQYDPKELDITYGSGVLNTAIMQRIIIEGGPNPAYVGAVRGMISFGHSWASPQSSGAGVVMVADTTFGWYYISGFDEIAGLPRFKETPGPCVGKPSAVDLAALVARLGGDFTISEPADLDYDGLPQEYLMGGTTGDIALVKIVWDLEFFTPPYPCPSAFVFMDLAPLVGNHVSFDSVRPKDVIEAHSAFTIQQELIPCPPTPPGEYEWPGAPYYCGSQPLHHVGVGYKSGNLEFYELRQEPGDAQPVWYFGFRHKYEDYYDGVSAPLLPTDPGVFARPVMHDIDGDDIEESLLVSFEDGTHVKAWIGQYTAAESNAITCTKVPSDCNNGQFLVNCVCTPCPAGTYRSDSNARYCTSCGSPDVFCPEGSTAPQNRTSGMCTTFEPYPSVQFPTRVSNDGFDALYFDESFVQPAAADAYVETATGTVSMDVGLNQGTLSSEISQGYLFAYRNKEVVCGQVEINGDPTLNLTAVAGQQGEGVFTLKNPTVSSMNYFVSSPFFVTATTQSGDDLSTKRGSVGGGQWNEEVRLSVDVARVPVANDAWINPKLLSFKVRVLPLDPFLQSTALASSVRGAFDVTVFVEIEEPTFLVLPTEVEADVVKGTVYSTFLTLYNLRPEQLGWSVAVTYFTPCPNEDNTDEDVSYCDWIQNVETGDPLEANAECVANVPRTDLSAADFTVNVPLAYNTTGLSVSEYEAEIVFIPVEGPAIRVAAKVEVQGGEVNWVQTKFMWATADLDGGSATGSANYFSIGMDRYDPRPLSAIQKIVVALRDQGGELTGNLGGGDDDDGPSAEIFGNWFAVTNPADCVFGGGSPSEGPSTPINTDFVGCPFPEPEKCGNGLFFGEFEDPDGNIFFETTAQLFTNATYRFNIAYSVDGGATQFPLEQFCIDVGALECTTGDPNSVANALGDECVCADGYGIQALLGGGLVSCAACGAGEYATATGTGGSCETCPTGYYAPVPLPGLPGAKECSRCATLIEGVNADQSGCQACDLTIPDSFVRVGDDQWQCASVDDPLIQQRRPLMDLTTGEQVTQKHPTIANATMDVYTVGCRQGYYKTPDEYEGPPCLPQPTGACCRDRDLESCLPCAGYSVNRALGLTDFVPCRSEAACPGVSCAAQGVSCYSELDDEVALALNAYNAQLGNLTSCSLCADGFTGPMCFKCATGYTRAGQAGCTKCLSRGLVMALLSAGALAATAITVYIIRRTIMNTDSESDEIIVLKILTSHMQAEGMVQNFDLEWPLWLMQVFDILDLISSAGQSIFSLDCIIDTGASNGTVSVDACTADALLETVSSSVDDGRVRTFFITSLFLASLPMLALVLTGGFWFGLYTRWKVKHSKNKGRSMYNYFLVSNVIVVFLLYPTLARTSLKFFVCSKERIGDDRLLEADFNLICWSDEHKIWAFTLGLLMVFLYAIGIPAGSFWILYKNQKGNSRYKDVFSFMFQGFRPDFYYWEVVIMIRKLGIAVCAIVIKPIGADIQANVALFVVFVAICLQIRVQPYEHARMNFAEIAGLMTLFFTLYLGLVQSSDSIDADETDASPLLHTSLAALIVTLNVLFLLYILWQLVRVTKQANQVVKAVFGVDMSSRSLGKSFRRSKKLDGTSAVPTVDEVYANEAGDRGSFNVGVQDVEDAKVAPAK